MPTDIDYIEMILKKSGMDVSTDCAWQRIKKIYAEAKPVEMQPSWKHNNAMLEIALCLRGIGSDGWRTCDQSIRDCVRNRIDAVVAQLSAQRERYI